MVCAHARACVCACMHACVPVLCGHTDRQRTGFTRYHDTSPAIGNSPVTQSQIQEPYSCHTSAHSQMSFYTVGSTQATPTQTAITNTGHTGYRTAASLQPTTEMSATVTSQNIPPKNHLLTTQKQTGAKTHHCLTIRIQTPDTSFSTKVLGHQTLDRNRTKAN